jgi:hypothetical protein
VAWTGQGHGAPGIYAHGQLGINKRSCKNYHDGTTPPCHLNLKKPLSSKYKIIAVFYLISPVVSGDTPSPLGITKAGGGKSSSCQETEYLGASKLT